MVRTRTARALLVCACVLALPGAASAATIDVTTTNDELVNGDGECSLREALTVANSDDAATTGCATAGSGSDTIQIPAGTYSLSLGGAGENANLTGDLDVVNVNLVSGEDQNTTFAGAGDGPGGTIIDGDGIDRLIDVQSDGAVSAHKVTVRDLTLTNGNVPGATDDGGAILMRDANATVTIDRSTISDNTAGRWGGALSWSNSSNGQVAITVTDSELAGNTAPQGGALWLSLRGDENDIRRSTFTGNGATGTDGGAVYLTGSGGQLDFINSTIAANTAVTGGGGIAFGGSVPGIHLYLSTVAGNSTPLATGGGGIQTDNDGQDVDFQGTIVSGNTANGVTVNCAEEDTAGSDGLFETNVATGDGDNGYSVEDANNTCDLEGDGNLVNANPLLGGLADNGGETRSLMPAAGSPALNLVPRTPADECSLAGGVDQRGVARPAAPAGLCDAGAVEADGDADNDGVADGSDNCQTTGNSDQANADGDSAGDACDADDDNDGVADAADNCTTANADQADTDGDGTGDACDADDDNDNDGVADAADNCATTANADQANTDGDSAGDACDGDDDNDGVLDPADNCPSAANASQENRFGDGRGDACEQDGVRPALSRLRLDPGELSVGESTRIRFTLSEAAEVTFAVYRRNAGRRVAGSCRRRTRSNDDNRRCDLRLRGLLSTDGEAGASSVRWSGRLRGRRLGSGDYRLYATPEDPAGNDGSTKRASFEIAARRR